MGRVLASAGVGLLILQSGAACSNSGENVGNAGSSGSGGSSGYAGSSGSAGSGCGECPGGRGGSSGSAGTGGSAGAGGAGGTAGGGSFPPNPRLTDLPDETALDLGQFECTAVPGEDASECRRTTDYSGFVYDPHHHVMLAFGGGHSTTMTDAIHALDLPGSLKWTDLYPPTACDAMTTQNLDAENGAWLRGAAGPFPRPVSTHVYDMLAVAPKLDEFLVIARTFSGGYCNPVGNDIGGKVAHFDRVANSWSFSPSADGATYDLSVNIPGSDPDPVSGKIVLIGRGGLALYDPSTRVYSQVIDTANGDVFKDASGAETDVSSVGYANHVVYYPPDDQFYLFGHGSPIEIYALSLNRADPAGSTLSRVSAQGSEPPSGELGYDYDAVNRVIGGAVTDSTFYAFDPRTLTWTSHPIKGGQPGSVAFHALAYDPVDNVFVFVTDGTSGAHTWAYRLKRK